MCRRYRPPGDEPILGLDNHDPVAQADEEADKEAEGGALPVWVKYNRNLHGSRGERPAALLDIGFVKKYLRYAKERPIKPMLTDGAQDFIAST